MSALFGILGGIFLWLFVIGGFLALVVWVLYWICVWILLCLFWVMFRITYYQELHAEHLWFWPDDPRYKEPFTDYPTKE